MKTIGPDDGEFCPNCGARGTMVEIGTRVDFPSGWRRWLIRTTHVYVCGDCGHVEELTETRRHHPKDGGK